MKKLFWFALILMLSILFTACDELSVAPPPATDPNVNTESAKVTRVIDGDTIEVLLKGQNYRVRYILVNTPETAHSPTGEEPFGAEATIANKALVEGKTVQLEKDVSETDQYGRLLRYVYVDGMMVNAELLRQGMAHVATFPPDVKYVDEFLAIQRTAQENSVGMWANWGSVQITNVNVYDEYVDIQNLQSTAQNLDGWTLVSERGNQRCALSGTLGASESLRVWARAGDANKGGFNCNFEEGIWSNSNPDPAVLLNPAGAEVYRWD